MGFVQLSIQTPARGRELAVALAQALQLGVVRSKDTAYMVESLSQVVV